MNAHNRIPAPTLMLALVTVLGFAGFANAQGHGTGNPGMGTYGGNVMGLTLEKQVAAQKI